MSETLDLPLAESAQQVMQFFAGRSESERRSLSVQVWQWYRLWQKASFGSEIAGIPWKTLSETLPVAVYSTASLAELKKAHCWIHDLELLLAIWEQRRPEWLQEWANWSLDSNPVCWRWVRALELRAWISRPEQESYWLGMIRGADRAGALALLEKDSQLLDWVWKLFEVEGKGENSLAAFDKYTAEANTWSYALLSLAGQGKLSRSRLLRASLEALGLDFEAFRAGWFSRFHEALRPTLEERVSLADLYAGLLASRIRATQSMAVRALTTLHKAGEVEWAHSARCTLPAVLVSSDKGIALAALKLTALFPGEFILEMAGLALEHSHAEVQAAALHLLREHIPQPTGSDWEPKAELLAPSVAALFWEWLGQAAPQAQAEANPLPTPSLQPVVACQDLQEVVQLAARMLESPEPAYDVERLLDGMLRFPRPQHASTQAIAKRARQRVKKVELEHRDLAQCILCWLDSKAELPEVEQTDLRGWLSLRLREVAGALHEGQPGQLLSLPEDSTGRIRAATLEARRQQSRLQLPMDLQQARWRSQEGCEVAQLDLGVEVSHFEKFTHRTLHFSGLAARQADFQDFQSLHRRSSRGNASSLRWQSTLWPAGREWWSAQGLLSIANNLDWWEARWGDRAYLESLLEPLPWGRMSRLLLAFGLACKQSEQVGLAVDASLLALAEGRLSGEQLGQSLAEVAETGMAKASRWARSLTEVGQQHPLAIWCALQFLLAQSAKGWEVGPLLRLLWELCHQLGKGIEVANARARLENFPGTGKAASIARKLLMLPG